MKASVGSSSLGMAGSVHCCSRPWSRGLRGRVAERRQRRERGTSLDAPGDGLHATIRTTSHGIPHILASNFAGLGYGYGYVAAKENICVLADTYVTVNAERSRWFGPDAHVHAGRQRGHPEQPQQRLLLPAHQGQGLDRGPARARAAARPAARDQGGACAATWPATTGGCATRAWTTSPTRAARAPPWVRPITEMDAYQRFYQLGLIASQGVAIDGIGGAQPPAGVGPDAAHAARSRRR